jgi:thiol-disulfide isomerase/thioredoxin
VRHEVGLHSTSAGTRRTTRGRGITLNTSNGHLKQAGAPDRAGGLSRRAALAGFTALATTACGSLTGEKGSGKASFGAARGKSSHYFKPGQRSVTPTVKGTTLAGRHADVATLRGSVVVINIWGSWCAPCRKEAPELARLYAKTKPLDVRFLGIDIRDNKAAAQAFERHFGIAYPSLFDPAGRSTTGFKQLAARAVPTTYVLDRAGKVAAVSIGPLTSRDFYPIVKSIFGLDLAPLRLAPLRLGAAAALPHGPDAEDIREGERCRRDQRRQQGPSHRDRSSGTASADSRAATSTLACRRATSSRRASTSCRRGSAAKPA